MSGLGGGGWRIAEPVGVAWASRWRLRGQATRSEAQSITLLITIASFVLQPHAGPGFDMGTSRRPNQARRNRVYEAEQAKYPFARLCPTSHRDDNVPVEKAGCDCDHDGPERSYTLHWPQSPSRHPCILPRCQARSSGAQRSCPYITQRHFSPSRPKQQHTTSSVDAQ